MGEPPRRQRGPPVGWGPPDVMGRRNGPMMTFSAAAGGTPPSCGCLSLSLFSSLTYYVQLVLLLLLLLHARRLLPLASLSLTSARQWGGLLWAPLLRGLLALP